MNYRVVIYAAGNERGGAASHLLTLASVIRQQALGQAFRFALLGSGPLADGLSAKGIEVSILPTAPRLAMRALRNHVEGLPSPVILHSHGPRLNVLAHFASRKRRHKWVSTIHSNIYKDFLDSRWKSILWPRLHRWSLKHADGLFVVHPMFAEWFPRIPSFVVPNGVSIPPSTRLRSESRAALRARCNVPPETPLFGIAARLDPVKDIPTLIRALPHLRTKDAHLVVAGDGSQRAALEQLCHTLQVADRVHFLGFIEDVMAFYEGLDVHVLASRSEGAPTSVLEAGAVGVPNVGTEIPALTRLLAHEETGLLFPVGDEQALAHQLDVLFEHASLRERLVHAFQQRVLPEFTPDKMLQAYLDGYEQILGHARMVVKDGGRM
ncbi:glycosyl transferase [Alicyclobacillus contaminans]|uniref:glycosyltransferase family 4 protein n=1 Tax=Alicyclobacillus contaminans TaxID=392016 RepID=UPI0004236703|nr:glycosyltransferase family 4 protein [Alicyclobacillus contaminans]GMA51737.1 glycosyl transferase [Alicyclobacillus contaminans]